jgi:hypothetical protein
VVINWFLKLIENHLKKDVVQNRYAWSTITLYAESQWSLSICWITLPRRRVDKIDAMAHCHDATEGEGSAWSTQCATSILALGLGLDGRDRGSPPTPGHHVQGTTLIRSMSPLQSVSSSDPDRVRGRQRRHLGARARAGQRRPGGPMYCGATILCGSWRARVVKRSTRT